MGGWGGRSKGIKGSRLVDLECRSVFLLMSVDELLNWRATRAQKVR